MLTVKNKKFYLDGEEFHIHSGSFHYFRSLPEYWEEILLKFKAAGLNCVETYTCWNMHEPHKGEFNFSGGLDIERFIQTAQKVGLKVIVRTGPYICAEWDNGGLPSWLLKKEYNIRFRCNSEPYMTHLRDWFDVLLSKIRPYLHDNGGPVIAMAVENEYGSFGDDFSYLLEVEKIYREKGMNCLYISADGNKPYHLCTGTASKNVVRCTDFGSGYISNIANLNTVDVFDPESPYFVVEYWAGNFTNWGYDECTHINNHNVKESLKNFCEIGASFNLYMFYGGTNFGFSNGAQGNMTTKKDAYNPCVTSYDYDAAISEWGGYTQRYFDVKEVVEAKFGKAEIDVPASPKLQNIGTVELTQSANLFDNLDIGKHHRSVTVESMEEFDQNGGYILYSKTFDYDTYLNCIKIVGLHDRAHIFVNKKPVGVRFRGKDESVIELPEDIKKGDTIDILVENMGRICYGEDCYFGDKKGITGAVMLTAMQGGVPRNPGKVLFNWDVTCFEMNELDDVKFKDRAGGNYPIFMRGSFKAENKNSCFVHYDNLKKGIIFVNGFNLGRYWEKGPLEALYIPGCILKEENEIVVFETDGLRGEPKVEINDVCGIPNHHEEIIV